MNRPGSRHGRGHQPTRAHLRTQSQSPIHITSVSDFDDDDDGLGIVDRVENSVVPLTEAELLPAGELLTARRARFSCKSSDLRDQALALLQWDGFEFLGRGGLDLQQILEHFLKIEVRLLGPSFERGEVVSVFNEAEAHGRVDEFRHALFGLCSLDPKRSVQTRIEVNGGSFRFCHERNLAS